MGYTARNFRGYMSGAGALKAVTLTTSGAATLASASITGAATVGTTLLVTGAVTHSSTLAQNGNVTMGAGIDLTMGSAGQIFADAGTVSDPGISIGGATTGFFSSGAGTVNTAVGGGQATLTNSSGAYVYVPIGAISGLDLYEQSAPTGLTNAARLFGVVDGGAKTDLSVIFQTGVAIVVEQEA